MHTEDERERDTRYASTLLAARQAANLTQRELASLLKCQTTWVSQLEQGHRRPSLPAAEAIARACGCEFVIGPEGMTFRSLDTES